MIAVDGHGNVAAFNSAAERLLCTGRSAVLGRPLDEAPLPASIVTCLQNRRSGMVDLPLGGQAELALERLEDPLVVVAWIRSADRRRSLLEGAEEIGGVGSWEWRPTQDELRWSDNLFRIFGLEPDELVPSPQYVFERTHPADRERVTRAVEALGAIGELAPLDYRIIQADGSVRHLRATLTVLEARDGRPFRIVGWVQDVSDQIHADREIAAYAAITEALTSWTSLDTGAARLLARLAEATDAVAGALWLPGERGLVPRVRWPRDVDPEAGTALAQRVWNDREPRVAALPRSRITGLRGAVGIPVLAGQEVLAVVELLLREKPDPTERLMRTMTGMGHMLGHFLDRRRGQLTSPLLTPREREVLQQAAHGLTGPQTAERLFVSPSTIKSHFENIYAKLGVSDRAGAVARALREGLIE